MESIIDESIENGEQQKTCIEAVSQVLSKNSTFLENLGLKKVSRKKSRIDVSSHVERLQFELDSKTQESAELREVVDALTSKTDEQSQEIDDLKKSSAETNALLRQLISFSVGIFIFFALSYS
jgi:predicted nuclease with TOPRIM domain